MRFLPLSFSAALALALCSCSGGELVGVHVLLQKDGSGHVTTRALVTPTASPAEAQAQVLSFLVEQWWDNGRQMCRYDNGTVLNVGARTCPLSIKVSP